MGFVEYIVPIILSGFFIKQYFNKKQTNDKRSLFMIVGVLLFLVTFFRFVLR